MAKNSGLVSIQLDIRVRRSKGTKITRALLDQAVSMWADTGANPRGFQIRIIDWKHGYRKTSAAGFSQNEARRRFRGLLQSGIYHFRIRGGKAL